MSVGGAISISLGNVALQAFCPAGVEGGAAGQNPAVDQSPGEFLREVTVTETAVILHLPEEHHPLRFSLARRLFLSVAMFLVRGGE